MRKKKYIVISGSLVVALLITTWPLLNIFSTSASETASQHQTDQRQAGDFAPNNKGKPVASPPAKSSGTKTMFLSGGRKFNPSAVELYRDDGKINLDLLEAAKVDPSRYDEAQDIIDSSTERLAESFRSRKVLIESESDPDKGVFSYLIPASDDSEKRRLESELKAAFGATSSEILMMAASRSSSMAGLGTQEIKVKVDTDTLMGRSVERFTWAVLDPVSSRILAQGGTLDRAEAWRRFGDFLAQ